MQVEGNIKMIGETQTFGSNGFRKRELVVTTTDQYPQHILIEFIQDKSELLDTFQEGQLVKVSINLLGREWINPQGEAKYFNSIQGWRIEGDPVPNRPEEPKKETAKAPEPETLEAEEDDDQLPF